MSIRLFGRCIKFSFGKVSDVMRLTHWRLRVFKFQRGGQATDWPWFYIRLFTLWINVRRSEIEG